MKRYSNTTLLLTVALSMAALPLFAQDAAIAAPKVNNGVETVVTPAVPVKAAKATKAAKAVGGTAGVVKKGEKEAAPRVVFAPTNNRDPFLSREEVDSIEKARLAEQKRIADERRKFEDAERLRQADLEKQRQLEEELKRNPARAIINKINVDGILGTEAIVNGEIVGKGGTVLGATVVKVTDDSVTFVYKGQRFVKKLPLM